MARAVSRFRWAGRFRGLVRLVSRCESIFGPREGPARSGAVPLRRRRSARYYARRPASPPPPLRQRRVTDACCMRVHRPAVAHTRVCGAAEQRACGAHHPVALHSPPSIRLPTDFEWCEPQAHLQPNIFLDERYFSCGFCLNAFFSRFCAKSHSGWQLFSLYTQQKKSSKATQNSWSSVMCWGLCI